MLPKTYAVIPFSTSIQSFSEESIVNELNSRSNEKVLYFSSYLAASKYCTIAQKTKYRCDNEAAKKFLITDENPNDDTPETKNKLFSQFYTPLVSYYFTELFVANAKSPALLILEVEVDKVNLEDETWSHEETYFAIQHQTHNLDSIASKNQQLITLTNEPFTKLSEPNFQIDCRKGRRSRIVSLCKADLYQNNITTQITFSRKYQKLSLLRELVNEYSYEKLMNLGDMANLQEVSVLFYYLQKEKMDPKKLFTAKENLLAYYIAEVQQANTSFPRNSWKQVLMKAIVYLLYSLLTIATGGIFGIFLLVSYLKTDRTSQHRQENNIESSTSNITRKIVITDSKHGIERNIFDFKTIQEGMYNYWNKHSQVVDPLHRTLNHRKSIDKANDYLSTAAIPYKDKLLQKQEEQQVAFNHRGELRKKIEFQDDDKAIVTGTYQQLARWGIYASYAKNEITFEDARSKLVTSWSLSQNEIDATQYTLKSLP